jgi:hypothetical protein
MGCSFTRYHRANQTLYIDQHNQNNISLNLLLLKFSHPKKLHIKDYKITPILEDPLEYDISDSVQPQDSTSKETKAMHI